MGGFQLCQNLVTKAMNSLKAETDEGGCVGAAGSSLCSMEGTGLEQDQLASTARVVVAWKATGQAKTMNNRVEMAI